LLHSFDFTVDAEETWRLQGEEGMAKLFALASKTSERGKERVIRIVATKEFTNTCRSAEGLKVSAELEQAGLKY
jgi:hypothetical protein